MPWFWRMLSRAHATTRRSIVDVVVQSEEGVTYLCASGPTGDWQCGRCEQGIIAAPEVGRPCPRCAAEVVAMRRSAGVWSTILLVMLALALGWLALRWWG